MTIRNGRMLPATKVKNGFGKVLNEIRRTGGPIVIERGGKRVAVILSVEVFERLRPDPRRAGDRRALARAGFGMWADRPDLDDEWLARGRARWQSKWDR